MTLEDIKEGDKIFVRSISLETEYIECEFHKLLSEEQSLIKATLHGITEFKVINNKYIVLDKLNSEKINIYLQKRNEYELTKEKLNKLYEELISLNKEINTL